MIWVTPQSRLQDILRKTDACHLVTFKSPPSSPMSEDGAMTPGSAAVDDPHGGLEIPHHLKLIMNDIDEPRPGLVLPQRSDVEKLLAFDRDRPGSYDEAPLVISCYAGISRSTAAAYILSCQRAPDQDETELALLLRRRAASATPNPLLIALADELLGRRGRMIGAIAGIGRGAEAFAGVPFSLP